MGETGSIISRDRLEVHPMGSWSDIRRGVVGQGHGEPPLLTLRESGVVPHCNRARAKKVKRGLAVGVPDER